MYYMTKHFHAICFIIDVKYNLLSVLYFIVAAGTFAVVLLLLGNSMEEVFEEHESLHNCTVSVTNDNSTTEVIFYGKNTTCEAVKVDVVVTVAFMSGLIMVVFYLNVGIKQLSISILRFWEWQRYTHF